MHIMKVMNKELKVEVNTTHSDYEYKRQHIGQPYRV